MVQPDFQPLTTELEAVTLEISRPPHVPVINEGNTMLTQLREMQAENQAIQQSIRRELQETVHNEDVNGFPHAFAGNFEAWKSEILAIIGHVSVI
ncbi:hypothetical protein MMC22_002058 [Lobaria immixta]|nr:hypothetical protein [Lobaria immixta]